MKGLLTTKIRMQQSITRLKKSNKKLSNENKLQKKELQRKDEQIATLLLRIEELERIVFGSKKNGKKNNNNNKDSETGRKAGFLNKEKIVRTAASYRRKKPTKKEITEVKEYLVDNCPTCNTALTNKQTVVQFVEDICLAILEKHKTPPKTVVKQQIEKGYCRKSRKKLSLGNGFLKV